MSEFMQLCQGGWNEFRGADGANTALKDTQTHASMHITPISDFVIVQEWE